MDGVAANDFVVSRYEEPEGWAAALSRLLGDANAAVTWFDHALLD